MKSIRNFLKILIIVATLLGISGCSSFGKKFKAFLNGKSAAQKTASSQKAYSQSFNRTPNFKTGPDRRYKRMTKEKLKEESRLSDRSGSLWVMEGQGAYLFSQNIIRMIGDSIAVRITGDPKQQLESKVNVIKKLLARLRASRLKRSRRVASDTSKKEGSKTAKSKAKKPAPKKTAKNSDQEDTKFAVRRVPTRIVERLVDGNYRIKGSQAFLIGNREYKAIVTGVVRAEDFSEEGIDANKLIDSKFDIVSVRKRTKSL